jgi:riboflavin kinase/FMN adenylyltransferase
MLILRHLERVGRRFRAPVLTLGNFDGVHRGHQEILRRLVACAQAIQGTPVVLTFRPHPTALLAPALAPRLLTDWRGRIGRIAATGADTIIIERFTRAFAEISAADFVRRFLVEALGVHTVVVGHRVSFGHHREGTAGSLRRFGAYYGFHVDIVAPVEVDNVVVSSSAVRHAISAGDLDRARAYLGCAPSVAGRVVHGRRRGKQLGFPTANLRISGMVLPPDGVYAVWVHVGDIRHPGVANLGFNPTFSEHEHHLEAHLFDFHADLYGRRIEVGFVKRLRGEIKFANVQALAEQIARDAAAARLALDACDK